MTNFVMTGATSGLGEVAANRLMKEKGLRLIVGARGAGLSGARSLPLDLSSLASVRAFAASVEKELGSEPIDALILNAGTQFANSDSRTADGFETTFATNHLAHDLLLRLLLPKLAQGATVVITSSGTHDPAEKTIIPAPRHANAALLAHPDRDPERDKNPVAAGGRAYASSKLCNILTARALANLPDAKARGFTVVAYDPGATPGTRLVRNGPLLFRIAWRMPPFLLRFVISQLSTQADAGQALADLALGKVRPPAGRIYASLRKRRITWPDPSELARRDDAMDALWNDSAKLVGLPA
jgi:NAD(P)-dependent dehydrogenase (short-subunit alcohol dehydrogenase family)